MNLSRWTAWTPNRETPEAWREWARGAVVNADAGGKAELAPSLKEIPPLLRRRAGLLGRAMLHVLSRPEMVYAGEALIFCSRLGEFSRALTLQQELAREESLSPQLFSMSVHNATGGLFMMAEKANAPLTALSAGAETAAAGLYEAAIQLADGREKIWLVYGEEPLPEAWRALSALPDDHTDYFALLLELTPGEAFVLTTEASGHTNAPASPLDLLRFFLSPEAACLSLSSRGNLSLRRNTACV
ncbi:3-oxoacyl-ACP synthase [Betaproteobacteria bacterium]|nr:3-oxoacyl-ACP synthase [Betaproteobacteria bacterium]GHU43968.1 3-oxoacyl-ACP synthase [Betaproteobacteria bacterium]